MPVVLAVAALAATGVSIYEQKKAADNAAATDKAVAQYNSGVDIGQAQQLDLDTQQNIRTQRQNDNIYLSRQATSYADAGVLSTSASPLHAQVTNAGRMEQQVQQQYTNSQQKQQQLYTGAIEGVQVGNAQASADTSKGTIAELNGGAKLASLAYQDYNTGTFSSIFNSPAASSSSTNGLF